jgi:hypothetical protein
MLIDFGVLKFLLRVVLGLVLFTPTFFVARIGWHNDWLWKRLDEAPIMYWIILIGLMAISVWAFEKLIDLLRLD